MEDFLYALRSFDGIGYYLTAILCVIFIMAIIGFLMERSQLREEKVTLVKKSEDVKKEENISSPLVTSDTQLNVSAVSDNSITPANGIIDFTTPSSTSMADTNSSTNDLSINEVTSIENPIPNIISSDNSISTISDVVQNNEVPPVLELNSSELEKNSNSSSDIK